MKRWLAKALLERGVRTELGIRKDGDGTAALRYYRRAAILGNQEAQFFLAMHYASGSDGRRNDRLAKAWFKRAASGGCELCGLVSNVQGLSSSDCIRLFGEMLR